MGEPLPLEGLKVLDFTWAVAGPMTTKLLAVFGADVLKVESRARMDASRVSFPFIGKPGRNSSGMFGNTSPSKMSIALNLTAPEAQKLARRLAAWADIVVENFSAGQMAEWGLDYESLRAVNPRLIMLSSSPQGQTGPHARHPGLGNLLHGLTGISHFTGWPDRGPLSPNLATPDLIVPPLNIVAVMAALEYRDRTGQGQYLDISQLELSLQSMGAALLDHSCNGQNGGPRGNRSSEAAPHGVYRCQGEDRWCAISVHDDAEWQALSRVLGDPPWTREPRFASLPGRLRNADELDRLLSQWTEQRPAEEVMGLLQEAGVPAGHVATGKELVEDPQLAHRGHFHMLQFPGGLSPSDGPAFRIEGVTPDFRRPPDLGEHTDRVCRDVLGLTDAEIGALKERGVLS